MEYQLITSNISQSTVLSPIERVLTNRGIPLEDISHFLTTTDNDIIDPLKLDNMRTGVEMLIKHISLNNKIFIQIDSDCDGYGSAALLINYLHYLFPAFVENNISYGLHEGKQHGLNLDLIPEKVQLVIAPDSSSNDYEQHQYLSEKGIDVLVIDHHEADKVSNYACVINNQLCDYPNKTLSGAGVVYKFCCYIDELMNTSYADEVIDLAALCIVADMVELNTFETRQIVSTGLQKIRNPFFYNMVRKNEYQIKGEVTPFAVSFYIAPYINATTRMGTQSEKMLLFESMLNHKGYELIPSTKRGCKGQMESRVEQACRTTTNIKNRQAKAKDASTMTIQSLIKEKNLLDNKILVIQLSKELALETSLTGLVATQLVSEYQRPTLILNQKEDENGNITWEGSGRGYPKSDLKDLKQFLKDSNLVMYADGHANAFGVGVLDSQYADFINYINTSLADFEFTPSYLVDFIFNGNNFDGSNILDLAGFKHIWGQGVEEPYVVIENLAVPKENLILMSRDKSPTLKIALNNNNTELIKFKSSVEEFEDLYKDTGFIRLNVVGRCSENIWNGRITPQLIIEDYEIIGEAQYYF